MLSTTTPSASRDVDISIPSGYLNYKLTGNGLKYNTADNSLNAFFTADNFSSTDTILRSERAYHRLDSANQNGTGTKLVL